MSRPWRRRDVLASGCAAALVPIVRVASANASVGGAILGAIPASPSVSMARWNERVERFERPGRMGGASVGSVAKISILAAQVAGACACDGPRRSLALDILFDTAHGRLRVHAFRADNLFARQASVATSLAAPVPASGRIVLEVILERGPTGRRALALPARAGVYAIVATPRGPLPRWRSIVLDQTEQTPRLADARRGKTPESPYVILSVGAHR